MHPRFSERFFAICVKPLSGQRARTYLQPHCITAMGFSAMFTFQLKGKHYLHLFAVMGVVDSFGQVAITVNSGAWIFFSAEMLIADSNIIFKTVEITATFERFLVIWKVLQDMLSY